MNPLLQIEDEYTHTYTVDNWLSLTIWYPLVSEMILLKLSNKNKIIIRILGYFFLRKP